MLAAMLITMMVIDTFDLNQSVAPGLSVSNAFLYAIILSLILGFAIHKKLRLEIATVHLSFALWIGYAIASWVFVSLFVNYDGYKTMGAAIRLKSNLIDHYLMFAVFFLGTRTTKDAWFVMKALLIAVLLGNAVSVLDGLGLIALGVTEIERGRVTGAMGEANQSATLVVTFLPIYLAAASTSRGAERLTWIAGALLSLFGLLLSASRGAVVGLLVGALCGSVLYRRYISPGRIVVGATIAVVLVAVAIASLSVEFADILMDRFVRQSTATGAGDLTSGRSEIWPGVLKTMMSFPWAIITGMGWDAYRALPFVFAPHNSYLTVWFDLGLIGLALFISIIWQVLSVVHRACSYASPSDRALMMGSVVGICAMSVTIFFCELYAPWPYIWACMALSTRVAVNTLSNARATDTSASEAAYGDPSPQRSRGADNFGWRANSAEERRIAQKASGAIRDKRSVP